MPSRSVRVWKYRLVLTFFSGGRCRTRTYMGGRGGVETMQTGANWGEFQGYLRHKRGSFAHLMSSDKIERVVSTEFTLQIPFALPYTCLWSLSITYGCCYFRINLKSNLTAFLSLAGPFFCCRMQAAFAFKRVFLVLPSSL